MATQHENPPPFEGGGASDSPAEVGAPLQEADESRIPTLGMHLLKFVGEDGRSVELET